MKSIKISLISILFIIPAFLFAQTGPGGIGTIEKDAEEGDVIIGLWLKADNLLSTFSNGDTVKLWPDVSGHDLDAFFPADRSDLTPPVFETNRIKYK